MEQVYEVLKQGLFVFLMLGGFSVLVALANAIRDKYLNTANMEMLSQAEYTATTMVQAAEQKFDKLYDVASPFLNDEQRKRVEAQRKLYNEDKKLFVLSAMKAAFPKLDIVVIDTLIEGALKQYKSSRRYIDELESKKEVEQPTPAPQSTVVPLVLKQYGS